jgi:citrate lyase synthetase
MTGIYSDEMDFSKWWYKNDLTHVFIYTKETLYWIKKEFGFKDIKIEKNFIRLSL